MDQHIQHLFLSKRGGIMRYLGPLLSVLVLAGCGSAPVTRNETAAASPIQVPAPSPNESKDSVVEFLLTSAATDFHKYARSDSVRVRHVRFGHISIPSGGEQYLLCGEFQAEQERAKADWMPFATIKTSGYEQWNGAQAESLCKRSTIIWDQERDLSSSLQSRLDSLR